MDPMMPDGFSEDDLLPPPEFWPPEYLLGVCENMLSMDEKHAIVRCATGIVKGTLRPDNVNRIRATAGYSDAQIANFDLRRGRA